MITEAPTRHEKFLDRVRKDFEQTFPELGVDGSNRAEEALSEIIWEMKEDTYDEPPDDKGQRARDVLDKGKRKVTDDAE